MGGSKSVGRSDNVVVSTDMIEFGLQMFSIRRTARPDLGRQGIKIGDGERPSREA